MGLSGPLITLGEASHDCFSQCNASADVAQARMWCVVTFGEARHDFFSYCNAGADVAQVVQRQSNHEVAHNSAVKW